MTLLKKIPVKVIFAFYIVIHILFFNVNFAEWGDSYRILRASEYVRDYSYPTDEKRPPLLSVLLALRPEAIDQVTWARVEMFIFSLLAFMVFSKFLDIHKLTNSQKTLSLLMFTLNPTFLYWSIRVMADIPFSLLVLLAFYLLKKYENGWQLFLVGIVAGASVLMRFEGYILGLALGLDLLSKRNEHTFKNIFYYGVGALLVMVPWLVYRNPLNSTYFDEPGGRAYDLEMVLIYVSSLIFLFGSTPAAFFMAKTTSSLRSFIKNNFGLFAFIVIDLVLVLVWPAAIPRIFIPVIPFLIVPIAIGITNFFKEESNSFWPAALFIVFVIAQYFLKLQFLVVNKMWFVGIVLIQAIIVFSLYKKSFKIFIVCLTLSMLAWSTSTILLHKNIFKPVVLANKYAVSELAGTIVYNDVSSVSDWYLNQKSQTDNVIGVYLNMDSKSGRTYKVLERLEADYLLITNEHNTDLEFDAEDLDYLEQIKEFRYTIRGKEFFTKIVKFRK